MPKFTIALHVSYTGRQTVYTDIEADDEDQAYSIAEDYDPSDDIDLWNADIDIEEIHVTKKVEDGEGRCKHTIDMFTGKAELT